jgi:peptidoglycan/xylan/chitin deacetylase (PgdA/CDA1 family)
LECNYSKENIETYIDNNWRQYGYTAKPQKYIALTFDDGPCPSSDSGGTEALLIALEKEKVKATFFVVGDYVSKNKTAAKAIFDGGHEIGSHGNFHVKLGNENAENIKINLSAADKAIKEITGTDVRFFRAPYLNHGDNLSEVCKELGMALIDGSSHNDWQETSEAIKAGVLANPQDGEIIILHDNNTSKGNTMSVLPQIIGGLRENGFWIMTVGELFAVKSQIPKAGQRYSSIINDEIQGNINILY